MKSEILAWLNGSQDYRSGVALYQKYGKDTAVLDAISKPENNTTKSKLFFAIKALLQVSPVQKAVQKTEQKRVQKAANIVTDIVKASTAIVEAFTFPTAPAVINEVVKDAYARANLAYQEMQNTRAVLLNMCTVEPSAGEDVPEAKKKRGELSELIVKQQQKVDKLFDDARYAEKHGCLPHGKPQPSAVDLHRLIGNLKKKIQRTSKKKLTPELKLQLAEMEAELKDLQQQYEHTRRS